LLQVVELLFRITRNFDFTFRRSSFSLF